MHRRPLLAGVGTSLLAGCTNRLGAPTSNPGDSGDGTTTGTTPTPTGPVESAGGVQRVEQGDDSVGVYLDGYDSMEYAEGQFFRRTSSSGVPAALSRSQVTSASQLQNALAFFGPTVAEVSVRMPLEDGYDLTDALDAYWKADADAERNADDERVYEFEGLRFTGLVVFYE